jgi:hypothetical protein
MAAGYPMVQFNIDQRIAQIKDNNAWMKTFDASTYTEMYRLYVATFEKAIAKVSQVAQKHVES